MKTDIIAFCDIDGSGKSSQILTSKRQIYEQGLTSTTFKMKFNPLNNYNKNRIKNYLIQIETGLKIYKNYSFLRTRNKDFNFILSDRHILCFLAYALSYDVKNIGIIKNIFKLIDNPNLILYFDVDIDTAINRIIYRSVLNNQDIQIQENINQLKKIQTSYEYLLDNYKNVEIINANQDISKVNNDVEKVIIKQIKNYKMR